jgi:hypothetical protein
MNKSFPMSTIYYPDGVRPYLSIIDDEQLVRIQIHDYDSIRPTYLVIDKKSIPALIENLEKFK